jgi:hypothetical protein
MAGVTRFLYDLRNPISGAESSAMARKKAGKPEMPATEAEVEMKAVRLYLPREHHRMLRQLAAANETNMALMARQIVMEYLDRKQPHRK